MTGRFAKAIEVQVNCCCGTGSPQRRSSGGWPTGGAQRGSGHEWHRTMDALAHAIGGERTLNEHLRQRLRHGTWLTASLPAILDDFARSVPSPGTHQSRVDRETAKAWRARLIGVGYAGNSVKRARVCVRGSTS